MLLNLCNGVYVFEGIHHGQSSIHLKQNISATGMTIPMDEWLTIHTELVRFDSSSPNEIHIYLSPRRWMLLTSNGEITAFQLRTYKGQKLNVKHLRLSPDSFKELSDFSTTMLNSKNIPPGYIPPPSVSDNLHDVSTYDSWFNTSFDHTHV